MTSLSDINYFDPSGGVQKRKLIKGTYKGHITAVNVVSDKMIGDYCANIYNITFTVAEENASIKYQDGDTEIGGSEFVGREVKSSGVFHFLTPKDGDSFQNNPSGNNKYYNLLKACGIECPTKEIEIDGAKKEVYILPSIELSDLEGKAVLAKVGETKPFTNAEGKEITPIKANWFEPWEGGVNRDFVEESIPF